LNQELDLDLIDDVYKAFGDAVKAAPEVLKNLSIAVKNYFAKHPWTNTLAILQTAGENI
jgi:hypothetical protein